MLLNFLRTRLHCLTISLLLACTISQPIHAGIFSQEPDDVDVFRFATAALSIPAHLASINDPNSRFFACATHTLKTINEIASVVDQQGSDDFHPLVIGWFWYDFINIFTSLCEDSAEEKSFTEDSDKATETKQFITETRYVLACMEGALRIAAALHNHSPRTWHVRPADLDFVNRHNTFTYAIESQQFTLNTFLPDTLPWNTHELLYRCTSLIRTVDLYLGREQGLVKKVLFLLLIAHAYAIYHQYDRTQEESFTRGRLHGIADGATGASAAIVTEIERQVSLRKRAEQATATPATNVVCST